MSWPSWVYLIAFGTAFAVEMWAVFNDRPGDTITARVESSPWLWVPVVVLCAWALTHFLFGHIWVERTAGIAMLIFAPVVWRRLRPDKRNRN